MSAVRLRGTYRSAFNPYAQEEGRAGDETRLDPISIGQFWRSGNFWLVVVCAEAAALAVVGLLYLRLVLELRQGFPDLGFRGATFHDLEPGLVVMFDLVGGDRELAVEQCRLHPNAVFCTDVALPEVLCRQVISNYPKGLLTYKKLQCLRYVHSISPSSDVVLAAVDSVLRCQRPPSEKFVRCFLVKTPIDGRKNSLDYTFKSFGEISFYDACSMAWIFIPGPIVNTTLQRIAFFEHFGSCEISFTSFWRENIGVELVEEGAGATIPPTRSCLPTNLDGMVSATRCDAWGLRHASQGWEPCAQYL
jgi:hypothetical protein